MSPLVTIAIPAYKGRFLDQTIESAINQTYNNIEIVIVNDKSPDDIRSIVKQFNDPRIRYYENEENLGKKDLVANWNKCLSYAKGEFFCLLCDDDRYEPPFVEDLLKLAEKYPQVDVFRSAIKIVNANGNLLDIYPSSPEFETMEDYMLHVAKGVRKQTISEWMIRTDHIKKCGGFISLPLAWGSDYVSIYRFSQEHGIVSIAKRNMIFRLSGINISSIKGETIIPKIDALNKKLSIVYDLLEESNCDFKNLIINKYTEHIRSFKEGELAFANIEDIIKVVMNKKFYKFSSSTIFHVIKRKTKMVLFHF